MKRSWLLAAALLGLACDAGDGAEAELSGVADAAAGKQDGFETVELAVGDSIELSVVRHRGGDVGPQHAKALEIRPGDAPAFAVVMRRVSGERFDPYLELFVDGNSLVTSDYDQALLPMASARDAVVVVPATAGQRFIAVAAELDLGADGSFVIDVVRIDARLPAIDFSASGPGRSALVKALRDVEPALAASLAAGTLVEVDGGWVEAQRRPGQSLREFAEQRKFGSRVNDRRSQLYDWLVRDTGSASAADVAAILPALWAALR